MHAESSPRTPSSSLSVTLPRTLALVCGACVLALVSAAKFAVTSRHGGGQSKAMAVVETRQPGIGLRRWTY